jgi:TrmH family RNA methyltransferase
VPLTKAELSRLRDLRDKKHREAAGLFVIEGEKVIGELLAAKYPLLEIYATTAWPDLASVGGVPSPRETSAPPAATSGAGAPHPQVFELTPEEMARASHFPTPSTVLAVGKINRVPLSAGALDRGLTLALDGIQDPGNVGTLLRLADWFGLDRVLLSPDCADLFSQKVINASMGSFARVTVHTAPLDEALAGAKAPVLGCDLAGYDVHTLKPAKDAVIVVGSEGRGISPPCHGARDQGRDHPALRPRRRVAQRRGRRRHRLRQPPPALVLRWNPASVPGCCRAQESCQAHDRLNKPSWRLGSTLATSASSASDQPANHPTGSRINAEDAKRAETRLGGLAFSAASAISAFNHPGSDKHHLRLSPVRLPMFA